jgi:hypothetical protein
MTPIIKAMIDALGGFEFDNRHSDKREELRRCLRLTNERKRNVGSRFNEVPGRDHSNDLRLQAV